MSGNSPNMTDRQQRTNSQAHPQEDSFLQDPEWKALAWGVGGAVALVLAGLAVGLIEGNLLPGDCEGLACVFTTVVLMYAGIVVGVWLIVGLAVGAARRRWSTSTWRLWALRVLAVLSWAPLLGLVIIALD
jgi:hypothetical protein